MSFWNEAALKHLDEHGYVVFKNILTDDQADDMRSVVMDIAQWEKDDGGACIYDQGKNQRIWNLLNKGPSFMKAAEQPDVLAAMKYLLGEDVLLSSWTVNMIGPGGSRGGLHADWPLVMLPDPLPSISMSANSIWLLDDFTVENGATVVVPGSHRSLTNPKDADKNHPKLTPLIAPKGSIIVFNGALWHANGENKTNRERVVLLGYFCRSFLRPMEDWQRIVDSDLIEQASPALRQLIGVGYGINEGTLKKPPAQLLR